MLGAELTPQCRQKLKAMLDLQQPSSAGSEMVPDGGKAGVREEWVGREARMWHSEADF